MCVCNCLVKESIVLQLKMSWGEPVRSMQTSAETKLGRQRAELPTLSYDLSARLVAKYVALVFTPHIG